ncbi:MAG: transketolase family protein [bacterium]
MTELVQTRHAYGEALLELGSERPPVAVLDADLYRSTQTVHFRDAFPERFFDIGISELDMVSTAAGMAATGLIPYCNSFAMFISGICYMPVRLQIAYPGLPVKLIGSSAGLTQGPDGASHQSLEDIAIMRALPNMVVISPADGVETRQATKAIADWPGPVYMRLGRYPVPCLFDEGYRFEVGKTTTLREGEEVAIFATGHMVSKAMDAAEILTEDGIEARVVNVSTIKPLDEIAVQQGARDAILAVSIEEHSVIGGLGGAIAECLSGTACSPPLLRLGVRDEFGESGLADELLARHRLIPELIAEDVRESLS